MSDSMLMTNFRNVRSGAHRLMERLERADLLAIPSGAPNNILWNFGHIVVDGCEMIYVSSDLKPPIPHKLISSFEAGTSPADWSDVPDVDDVLEASHAFTKAVQRDYEAGAFELFDSGKVSSGWPLATIEEVIGYHTIHESIHLGYMMALARILSD